MHVQHCWLPILICIATITNVTAVTSRRHAVGLMQNGQFCDIQSKSKVIKLGLYVIYNMCAVCATMLLL